MSNWLLLVIGAYFILAIVNLADKFLLDNFVKSSKTYTFLVSILGAVVLIIAPWYLHWPGFGLFNLNLLVGALFPLALLLLYRSLKLGEASIILVVIGGSVPISSFLFSLWLLGEKFSPQQLLALFLLVLGTVIIAWVPPRKKILAKIFAHLGLKTEHERQAVVTAVLAGLVFGLFFVGSKWLYNSQNFISAFIWIRLGSLMAGLLFLLEPRWRREIWHNLKKLRKQGAKIFFANQLLSAVGFSLQNYAIALGSVAVVNALQGVQYALLLLFGGLLTIFFPKIIKENINRGIIIQKIIAIIIIAAGLYLLAIKS